METGGTILARGDLRTLKARDIITDTLFDISYVTCDSVCPLCPDASISKVRSALVNQRPVQTENV